MVKQQAVNSVSLFTLVAIGIVGCWWWLARPMAMPPFTANQNDKLYCVSYAPFRGTQTPLDRAVRVDASQIDADLAQLAKLTGCIRTYSVDAGLDQIPEIARRHGLKVLLGLWVSGHTDRTEQQIDIGVALANRYPDVISAVIVGNEVLLRGEASPSKLRSLIERVKSRVPMPVTYADVWEFWSRHNELASAVDFVTVHILPYWEDVPIAADKAAEHVLSIYNRVVKEFPQKEILIGEFGWPSAGRMRETALPSPVNQARVIAQVIEFSKRDGFRVNIVEAFDQPWKRFLEGTVGGHWGLFDDRNRAPKFVWGAPVSNHPHWRWLAVGGIALAAATFAAAAGVQRDAISTKPWSAVAFMAFAAGMCGSWTIVQIGEQSLGIGDWIRSLTFAVVAIAVPIVAAAIAAGGKPVPTFVQVVGPRSIRTKDPLIWTLGLLLAILTVLAVQSALALAFDPRYRDFPFAPMTSAVTPFVLLSIMSSRGYVLSGVAETMAAVVLTLCAAFISWNEGFANWQAQWFALISAVLAFSLLRARDAQN